MRQTPAPSQRPTACKLNKEGKTHPLVLVKDPTGRDKGDSPSDSKRPDHGPFELGTGNSVEAVREVCSLSNSAGKKQECEGFVEHC
jgi:hypothetical protein